MSSDFYFRVCWVQSQDFLYDKSGEKIIIFDKNYIHHITRKVKYCIHFLNTIIILCSHLSVLLYKRLELSGLAMSNIFLIIKTIICFNNFQN